MIPLLMVMFLLGAGLAVGAAAVVTRLPDAIGQRRLERRLQDVTSLPTQTDDGNHGVVRRRTEGPLPGLDRLATSTAAGKWLGRLIAQSGTRTTPSAVALVSLVLAALLAGATAIWAPFPWLALPAAGLGAGLPLAWLRYRRSGRLRRFEEQFPETLELLSRAIRAGHAFQTALGMVASEMPEPIGPEFKKTFDEQSFGLPLAEALDGMAVRVPLMDVRFFVTAVLIQRETGGNLSEILDKLASVVRERFKIHRQVRVHTAHGRFTGWVLVMLPAALAIALQLINPAHMQMLFHTPMGQNLLIVAIVMQTIGFFWIRHVIKIEV